MYKALKIIGNLIIVFLILILMLYGFSAYQGKVNPEQLPTIIGFTPMSVLSGSMRPALEPGDLIIVREIEPNEVEQGDIITYRQTANTLVTHRVISINSDGSELRFTTQGDANNIADSNYIYSEQIIGKLFINIPKGGYVINFIKSPIGFLMLIVLPLIILITGEIKGILYKINSEKKKGEGNLEYGGELERKKSGISYKEKPTVKYFTTLILPKKKKN